MKKDTTGTIVLPASSRDLLAGSPKDVLTEILRHGACELLATAVEAEVAGYIEEHAGHTNAQGHRLVVRNGHHRERTIQTGLGSVAVKAPRVEDRRTVGRNEDGDHLLVLSIAFWRAKATEVTVTASESYYGLTRSPCAWRTSVVGSSAWACAAPSVSPNR